jgi:hypothetical protein
MSALVAGESKLVVLADIPVLMLWWVLSTIVRPPLAAAPQQA